MIFSRSSNRTFMELKLLLPKMIHCILYGSNRTFMELKLPSIGLYHNLQPF